MLTWDLVITDSASLVMLVFAQVVRDSSISVIVSARIIGAHVSTIKTLMSSWKADSTEWRTRNDIKLDMLIWLSESILSGLFSEVSLILDNQVREFKGNSLIIKGLDNQALKILIITDNQVFHHVSPKFFNSQWIVGRPSNRSKEKMSNFCGSFSTVTVATRASTEEGRRGR